MINEPPFLFKQRVVPFTVLLVQGYFEALLFLYLSNHVFLEFRNFGNTLAMSVIFFLNMLKM